LCTAACVINLYHNGKTRVRRYLREKSYINDRNPGKAIFFKTAGKNCILIKLLFFSEITFNWIGNIREDALRRNLKKQFIKF